MSPDVSVVVPTHDRPGLLRRTLATVLWQTNVDLEVVVADDGAEWLASCVLHQVGDQRVRVVAAALPHSSPRAARKVVGTAVPAAQWVAFLDDDDLLAPDSSPPSWRRCGRCPRQAW